DLVPARIAVLAGLPPLEYELIREAEAKALGLRVSVLDKEVDAKRPRDTGHDEAAPFAAVDPWPDPVNGAALADEIRALLMAHVIFGAAGDADTATLWAIGTYLMNRWRLWPRLMITSPTKACGKSTLLEVLEAVVSKGFIASNISTAGVFRAIEAWKPSLLLDESDTWMKDNLELAGILNSGHTKRTAKVVRVEDKGGILTPTLFSTWTPIAFAGIGSQRDTLVSRSVIIGLRRKMPTETVARLPADLFTQSLRLRRQAARWADDNGMALGAMEIEPPECGNDRRRDNYTPLYRIAELLGGKWPDRLAAAYALRSEARDDSDEPAGVMLLADLSTIFAERGADRLQTADLVQSLNDLDERPWLEWRNGRPLASQSIAKLLRPFEVRPRNAKVSGQVLKSYYRADVDAAYQRYCADPPKTPLPRYPVENKDANEESVRYHTPGGSGLNGEKYEQYQGGSGVAANLPTPNDMGAEGEL
ncbi:MAG: DUF3631 domain-containing protein, partial [Allgaiera sp.]|nr:DUF3631 domain-containing protein [Allgaiera sp.]